MIRENDFLSYFCHKQPRNSFCSRFIFWMYTMNKVTKKRQNGIWWWGGEQVMESYHFLSFFCSLRWLSRDYEKNTVIPFYTHVALQSASNCGKRAWPIKSSWKKVQLHCCDDHSTTFALLYLMTQFPTILSNQFDFYFPVLKRKEYLTVGG